MNTTIDQLAVRLAGTVRCRPEIQELAGEWAEVPTHLYDSVAVLLSERGEGKTLGILLNVAAANRVKLEPGILAGALKRVEDIRDFHFPYRDQDASAIGPLLGIALAEDLSWERQALAAYLAAELSIKFEQPRQPVKKVLWTLAIDILTGEARLMINAALALLESKEPPPKELLLTQKDVLAELPKNRPPVVIGGDYTVRRPLPKLGRNEPCHCGSGRKYKKCCFDQDQELLRDASAYQGITRAQLLASPALVDDVAPIENMRLHELPMLVPATLNDDQLFAAYRRAELGGLRELSLKLLLELKDRPGNEQLAISHMVDLFASALQSRDRALAGKLAALIPAERLYHNAAQRLEHALLDNPDKFAELETICKAALTGGGENRDHLLLELSYAFAATYPAMSVVFGRAAIVSEPDRHFDNEVLMESIEKSRIILDLEPWGDPSEEILDWRNQEGGHSSAEKDREIAKLKESLTEAKEKGARAMQDLRRKELDLAELEKKLQSARSAPPVAWQRQGAASPQPPSALAAAERNEQAIALRRKIETLKDEIRSQQTARQHLRRQLQEVNAAAVPRPQEVCEPGASPLLEDEADLTSTFPRKILIPEFADTFRKNCETVPRSIAAKAVQAAAGFAARDESVIRQTVAIEQLPGFFRVRIGLHHRLLIRQTIETLQVIDIIPRQKLETWIRQRTS